MDDRRQRIRVSILLTLAAAAAFGGCASHQSGRRVGSRETGSRGDGVPTPAARSYGESAAGVAVRRESAVDSARVERYAQHRTDLAAERPVTMTENSMPAAQSGGDDRAGPTQTPAQAGEEPMTGMQTRGAGSQAASMTEAMGAPGLVPFDVMTGQAGKWMVGYQFMIEESDGNLVGTRDISEAKILERFTAAPTDMTMQMHMAMLMFAPTDRLTLMVTVPYIRKIMNHRTVDGARFAERTEGMGDIELRGMYAVYETRGLRHRLLLNGGVGLPTGSINARMDGMRLEYPMQIGSGTFSLLPGITYLGQASAWGWAADLHSTVRLGQNDNNYRLGNRYQSSASIARELPNGVSLSAGVRGEWWGNINGADPLLDPADEPTKDPDLQGGRRLSALFGINLHPENGPLEGQHFHVQFETPIVESLDGPQLKQKWVFRIGWQLEF